MQISIRSASFMLAVVLVSGLSGCATAIKTKGGDKPADQAKLYSYRVKYLCSYLHPFPTVFHWTDINILNPSKTETALVMKKFVASGKQKKPSPIPPKRDEFQLKPNQSANIDCDEIQSMLKKPFSTPMEGFVEIESRTELTVVGVYDKCVPQPRTDVFPRSVVTGRIKIDGLVPDETSIRFIGPVVVKKGEPHVDLERNRFVQSTEIESMNVRGVVNTSRGPVEVEVLESPNLQSGGQISGKVAEDTLAPQPPYDSSFDVNAVIRISAPEQEPRDLIIRDARIVAKITSVPPGPPSAGNAAAAIAVNRYCGQQDRTPLYDADTGKEVGYLADHCHDPNPPPTDTPPPVEHVKVPCDNASIDVEYIQPAVLKEGEDKK